MPDKDLTPSTCPAPLPGQPFLVRLSRPWWQAGLSDNTLGLRGAARLICTADRVHLQAAGGSRAWPAGHVFNVVREGCSVSFRTLAEDRLVDHVRVWLPDVRRAQALRAALPAHRTDGAVEVLDDHHRFADHLDATRPAARWTRRLVALNLLVFVLVAGSGAGWMVPEADQMVAWGTNFAPLTLDGQWWRLLTSMFLHFGVLHLAFNMWALASGGAFAERLFGPARFLVIYFAAGLTGSLTSALWNPAVNSAGASGAIVGVFGAILAWFQRGAAQVPASVMRHQRNNGLLILGVNLGYGALQPGIDNAAHLGGLVAGLVLGWWLARPLIPLHSAE